MDREIKFRGKRLDNNRWVYGSLIIDNVSGKYFINIALFESDKVGEEGCLKCITCEIDKKTVGQFTGLYDKNNKEIYENDTIKFSEYPGENYYAEICKSEKPPFNWIYGYKKKPDSKCRGISNNIYRNLNDIEELGEVEIINNK